MQFDIPPFPLIVTLSDRQNVLNFAQNIPEIIKRIFDEAHSNLLEKIENDQIPYGISQTLFLDAFEEAKTILVRQLELNNLPDDLDSKLLNVGLTGDSLKLKSALMNKLWQQIVDNSNSMDTIKLNFSLNDPIKRFVEKFLKFLNSVLGSLLSGLPGVEPLKELKEFLEQYLDE